MKVRIFFFFTLPLIFASNGSGQDLSKNSIAVFDFHIVATKHHKFKTDEKQFEAERKRLEGDVSSGVISRRICDSQLIKLSRRMASRRTEEIMNAVHEIGEANGYSLVLQMRSSPEGFVAFGDPSALIDITDDLVAILNSSSLD